VSAALAQHADLAYVLHSFPYRETSMVVEFFSRGGGRFGAVARGAKRPQSQLRGSLQAFQPLRVSWFGKNELRTLRHVEWVGGRSRLDGARLLCGYYLNELLLRLVPREDPNERLFDAYDAVLAELEGGASEQVSLRRFERQLLQELGIAPTLTADAAGAPVAPAAYYRLVPESGLHPCAERAAGGVTGKALMDLAGGDFSDPRSLLQMKRFMRQVIDHQLDGKVMVTRGVFEQLQGL
jgi:DNA repair protein RecO (recombination protein O)